MMLHFRHSDASVLHRRDNLIQRGEAGSYGICTSEAAGCVEPALQEPSRYLASVYSTCLRYLIPGYRTDKAPESSHLERSTMTVLLFGKVGESVPVLLRWTCGVDALYRNIAALPVTVAGKAVPQCRHRADKEYESGKPSTPRSST